MKLGSELKMLQRDLAESIEELKEVIQGLKTTQAAVWATQDDQETDRYGLRSNGRALAEKIVMVSLCWGDDGLVSARVKREWVGLPWRVRWTKMRVKMHWWTAKLA